MVNKTLLVLLSQKTIKLVTDVSDQKHFHQELYFSLPNMLGCTTQTKSNANLTREISQISVFKVKNQIVWLPGISLGYTATEIFYCLCMINMKVETMLDIFGLSSNYNFMKYKERQKAAKKKTSDLLL